jgi:hypothetical protein
MERRFVFLDPDGTSDLGLILLVLAPTGVEYQTQAAGLLTKPLVGEGFLIPLGRRDLEARLMRFFQSEFQDHSYAPVAVWTEDRLRRLDSLVGEIPVWETRRDGGDARHHLTLDRTRIDDLTEAWIPVLSPYGPAVLLFENCD